MAEIATRRGGSPRTSPSWSRPAIAHSLWRRGWYSTSRPILNLCPVTATHPRRDCRRSG